MQVFKCAMGVIRGNLVFPLVYIVGLSFMGLAMAMAFGFEGTVDEFQMERGSYAVIDRDGSALSQGVAQALQQMGDQVAVADDRRAMQDAVAKGRVDYLLMIPQGFGEGFAQAVRAGQEPPAMEAAYSFYSMAGAFADQSVDGYLSLVRSLMAADPQADAAQVAQEALRLAAQPGTASVIPGSATVSEADRFVFYLQWSTYTLFAGIVVCVGLLTGTLGRADVRRRNLASPLSFASYTAQLALACAVVTLVAWGWTLLMGLVAFPQAAAAISPVGLGLCAAAMLAYCLGALAFGLLLGQLGASSMVCNAVGNIVGMVLSFFGGAWVPLDILSPEVVAAARWLPGYWYTTTCQAAAGLAPAPGIEALLPVFQGLGVLLMFAVAVFCVSLVAGRIRLQTAQAGGNRAAEAAA